MTVTDELLSNAEDYAANFDRGIFRFPGQARRDSGLHGRAAQPLSPPGLSEGDAHVIRNAGGVVTDDEIRSLAISQRLLVQKRSSHPPHRLRHADLRGRRVPEADYGRHRHQAEWAAEAFDDLEQDVRQSIARINGSPFIRKRKAWRGFVYDVRTGRLSEVA